MRIKWLAAIILIVAAVVWFGLTRLPGNESAPAQKALGKGGQLPESTTLETLGGKKLSARELRGKVLLVNFWASWCAPCIREMPSIYRLHAKLKERGFVVLPMNMDDDPNDGIAMLKGKVGPAPFEIYKGIDSEMLSLFDIEGLPYSAIIDKNGNVVLARPGEADWDSPEMRGLIEGML